MRLKDKYLMRKEYGDTPFINENSTTSELLGYFSWCGNVPDKKKLIDEFFAANPDLDNDQYVESSILAVNYGINEGMTFPESIRQNYLSKLGCMKRKVVEKDTSESPTESVKKMSERQTRLIAHVEDMADELADFDFVSYANQENIDIQTCNIIREKLELVMDEFIQARDKNDEQLAEAYNNIGKRQLNKLIKYHENLLSSIESYKDSKKSARKPRKKKKKTPEMILKHFACMEKYGNIVSIDPKRILESTHLWVFDTKYKKMTMFVAKEGETLSVYRTAIINYDPDQSVSKRVGRRETEMLTGVMETTPAKRKKLLASIKTSALKIPDRINNNVVLLHAGR